MINRTKQRKRICLDIRSLITLYSRGFVSGIGRTTFDLVKALEKINRENTLPFELILYSQNMKGIDAGYSKLDFPSRHFYFRDQPFYDKIIKNLRLKELFIPYDLYHIPHNFGYVARPEKTVVTIHDAIFFTHPESFFGHEKARTTYPSLAQSCKAIITCSGSSKRDIVKHMGVKEEKVTVIPWGVSTDQFYPAAASNVHITLEKFGVKNPYFIMASCNQERKNTGLLMENFRNYRENGGKNDLVLVWKNCPENILKKYEREINQKTIHVLAKVDDNDLRNLYTGATATFFPSKYEGFGLPVLESFACGTPVVTCRNSSLEEVGGDTAFYVSENSETDMAQFMYDFENNKYDFSQLKEAGLKHIKDFTWKNTAEKYIEFYMDNL